MNQLIKIVVVLLHLIIESSMTHAHFFKCNNKQSKILKFKTHTFKYLETNFIQSEHFSIQNNSMFEFRYLVSKYTKHNLELKVIFEDLNRNITSTFVKPTKLKKWNTCTIDLQYLEIGNIYKISICYKNDYYLRNAKLNIYQCSTDKESDRLLRNKRQADEEPSSQYTTTPLFLESESSSLATITEENITTTEENSSEIDFTTTNTETSSALPLIDKNISENDNPVSSHISIATESSTENDAKYTTSTFLSSTLMPQQTEMVKNFYSTTIKLETIPELSTATETYAPSEIYSSTLQTTQHTHSKYTSKDSMKSELTDTTVDFISTQATTISSTLIQNSNSDSILEIASDALSELSTEVLMPTPFTTVISKNEDNNPQNLNSTSTQSFTNYFEENTATILDGGTTVLDEIAHDTITDLKDPDTNVKYFSSSLPSSVNYNTQPPSTENQDITINSSPIAFTTSQSNLMQKSTEEYNTILDEESDTATDSMLTNREPSQTVISLLQSTISTFKKETTMKEYENTLSIIENNVTDKFDNSFQTEKSTKLDKSTLELTETQETTTTFKANEITLSSTFSKSLNKNNQTSTELMPTLSSFNNSTDRSSANVTTNCLDSTLKNRNCSDVKYKTKSTESTKTQHPMKTVSLILIIVAVIIFIVVLVAGAVFVTLYKRSKRNKENKNKFST